MIYIPLILVSVSLNAIAQLCLKKGMTSIGHFQLSLSGFYSFMPRIAMDPFIILGMASYAISIAIWLAVLSRVEVSFAYPFLGVGYIIVAGLSYFLFGENLSTNKVLGIIIVSIGLIFLSRAN